jgi:uncharacterized membrane protein
MTTASTFDTTAGNLQEKTEQAQHAGGRQMQRPWRGRNISQQERLISAGAGALLALYGLRRITLKNIAITGIGAMLLQRAWTGHCNLYGALGISTAETGEGAAPEEYFARGIHVEESFTILKSPEELYTFWHNFENLPRFMRHLKSVRTIDEKRSHWAADAPMGMNAEWDAEIINDEPNRIIAWRSLAGADVDNAGSVNFRPAPGDRGTEVSVVIDYIPPAGKAGSLIAKLFGRDADQMIREDLRNFKRLMETGEIPTIQGQPRGNCRGS